MEIKLKTLSPLHIGCDQECSGLGYLMDKRKKPPLISILNEDLVLGALNDDQMKKFISWIEKEKYPNLFFFFKHTLKDTKFLLQNKIQKKAMYAIPNYAGDERLGRSINSFIKQMNHPYIPGTEIKGAIRTAVLYCTLLESKELFLWLKNKLEEFKNDHLSDIKTVANNRRPNSKIKNALGKDMAKIESQFQEKILCCKPKDAKYDVMKFIRVSDSELLDARRVLAVSYVTPFNINMKFSVFYEYLKPDTEISFSTLGIESEKSLSRKLRYMEFNNKQKRIVSGTNAIFNYCYRFSQDLLNEEISFFREKGKQQIVDQLKRIVSLNKPEAPVLRIGKDQGYNSLTVGLAVRKLDKKLYEDVLIHATKNKSYDSRYGGPMPKSRKIVYWNGMETTAGWVKLVPESDSTPQENPQKNPANRLPKDNEAAHPVDFSMLGKKFKVVRKIK